MRVKIQDEFTHLPVSRQRKHQLRRARDGKCLFCDSPAVMEFFCLKHLTRHRERSRKLLGIQRRNRRALRYRLAAAQASPPKDPADYLPTTLSFALCLGDGPCHQVKYKEGHIVYRTGKAGLLNSPPRVITVLPIRWQVFWMALEDAKVWEWRKSYSGNSQMDVKWKVSISFKNRLVNSSGENGFPSFSNAQRSPVFFERLLVALRQLAKLRDMRLPRKKQQKMA